MRPVRGTGRSPASVDATRRRVIAGVGLLVASAVAFVYVSLRGWTAAMPSFTLAVVVLAYQLWREHRLLGRLRLRNELETPAAGPDEWSNASRLRNRPFGDE